MRDTYILRECYWCHEYMDMNATVPTCEYYGKYGDCPCEPNCKHRISSQEVNDIIRKHIQERKVEE